MRLLNTYTIKVEEHGGGEVPRYAILSHTWGKEEVTLQDITSQAAHKLKGYEKVQKACSIAQENHFDYIWIDTCCIDKTSSAELSEAINSMYRWYEEAEVCYAYLSDVPHGYAWNDDFRNSKWFTRGWTLQELIAPSTVIFFDSEWHKMDDKLGLHQQISGITGIPGNFLLGDDVAYASVAQKMSWAAKRKTTRIEDVAYCLMGIFGISMPMLYGEGTKAFIRLQEEIMRTTNDHSLFAWTSTDHHGGVLASSPAAFAGSGNVIPAKSFGAIGNPITLSSRGINLSLRYKSDEQGGSGLAILDCTRIKEKNKRLAIRLKDVLLTNQNFTRERSSELEVLDLTEDCLEYYPMKSLYVRPWRSVRHRKQENVGKCAVRFKGVQKEDMASCTVYQCSSWGFHDDLLITTTELPADGTIGRLVVLDKEGNSFQIVLKRSGGLLFVDIHNSLQVHHTPFQDLEQQQYERDQIASVLDNGQHIYATIDKRTFMLHGELHILEVVEIDYPVGSTKAWLQQVAVLEGYIEEGTLLPYAARRGSEAVIRLLDKTNKCASDFETEIGSASLTLAAKNGHEGVVNLLLQKGIDLQSRLNSYIYSDNHYLTFLSYAAQIGNEAAVQLLLERGDDIEFAYCNSLTPLSLAAYMGHEAVVKLLLDMGADLNSKSGSSNMTPLLYATSMRREAVVKLLLNNGAYIESKTYDGQTALSLAAQNGYVAMVKVLLESGADIESRSNYGQTALALAAMRGHKEVAMALLENGADIESRENGGHTSLLLAAWSGHKEMVMVLLENGADIESRSDSGETALLSAVRRGHKEVVKALLESGADTESRSNDGQTALSLAARKEYKEVVKALLESGADMESVGLLSYMSLRLSHLTRFR